MNTRTHERFKNTSKDTNLDAFDLIKWPSLYDMKDDLIDFYSNPEGERIIDRYLNQGDNFAGCSMDQAHEYMDKGYEPSLPNIKAATDSLQENSVNDLSMTFDVAGDDPDIDRYLAAEPENMVSYPLVQRPVPHARIIFNASVSGSVKKDDIEKRGVAMCAAIDSLRKDGITVELTVIDLVREQNDMMCIAVDVADSRFTYNPTAVYYALAHPSFLRRISFAVYHLPEMPPHHYGARGGSYGMPTDKDLPLPLEEALGVAGKPYCFVHGILSGTGMYQTPEEWRDYILREIQ